MVISRTRAARRIALLTTVASCLLACADVNKPLLRHIVAPREAIDLCGEWDYRKGVKTEKFSDPTLTWGKAKVPGRIWFDIHNEPPKASDAMYRRTFTLTKAQAAKHAELFFEQACYHTLVIVNGKEAFRSYEWSTPFRFDVTPFVREGENTLEVRCWIDPDYPKSGNDVPVVPGWVWGAYTGICRPVHLELMDPVHVSDVRVEPRVAGGKELAVFVCVTNGTGVACKGQIVGEVKDEGQQWMASSSVVLGPGEGKTVELKKAWPEAHLWNPDDPYLYNLNVTLHCSPSSFACVDAVRQRFGFREFRIDGTQVTLNGHPFINRRDSVSLGTVVNNAVSVDDARMRKMVNRYKSRGFVGMRTSPACLYRELEVCDEMGFLVEPLLPTGAGYNRNDCYWPAVSNMVRRAVMAFRNHPSMMYWCLFNEFGKNYGVKPWREQYPKMVAMGDYLKSLDPTTFWTSCGDTELDPVDGNGPGPAPVRSLHYPVNTSWGGRDYPEIGWWYAKGLSGWQGHPTKTKPTFISEDFYHGMNDKVPSMTRWGSDAVYEADGYVKAWRAAVLMMADGHYYGGLGEWNPWFTSSGVESNLLFTAGELMPTYLVSLRHAFPNLAVGAAFEDDLYVHNQSFTERKLTLALDYSWKERETREIVLAPGGRYDGKLSFAVPEADGSRVKPITVTARISLGGSNVFTRVFSFNVIPTAKRFPKGAVLLAAGETPLKEMFPPDAVFTNAVAALAAKPTVLVASGALAVADGQALDAWVREGGRAVMFASSKDGWCPVPFRGKMTHAYAWRRTPSFLKDVPENFFSVWRPTATLDQYALTCPTDCDAQVLLDEGGEHGIAAADAIRLLQGKGTWTVTSIPVETCFAEEPAARYFAVRLAADALRAAPSADGGYAFAGKSHPLAAFFAQNGFLPPVDLRKAAVVLADAADEPKKILSLAKAGKTVFVTGVGTNATALLKALGLGFAPTDDQGLAKQRKGARPLLLDDRRNWFTRVSDEGLLAGLSNTDFAYTKTEFGYYFRWCLTGYPVYTDEVPLASGLFADHALLHPNAMAEVPVGKGRVVPISIDFASLTKTCPQKMLHVWRTLLLNAGARTAAAAERHTRIPCPILGSNNHHFWAEPGVKAPAWFGNGDDMRYFPVNLCGWSLEANNKCPVEPFPTDVLYYGGIPFRIRQPQPKSNAWSVRINEATAYPPDEGGSRLSRLWILGALEDDEGLAAGTPVLDLMVENGKDVLRWHTSPQAACAKYGEDLGAYRRPIPLTRGRIGWEGPSEKTKKAALYVFAIENVFDKSLPVKRAVVRAVRVKGKPVKNVAIVGLCWEKE